MDDADVLQLVLDRESDRVERKRSLSDPDRIREAICGFANDLPNHRLPGVVAVGVNDDGSPTGEAVNDELLLKLATMRDDGKIVPFPSITVRAIRSGDHEFAAVVVHPSDSPPVQFSGRIWVRVGPRRGIATPEEAQRLAERRRAANLPFDARPLGSTTLEDLALITFQVELLPQLVASEVLEANHRPLGQQLAALHFADLDGHLTPAGILLCGLDPSSHVPGAYLQFLRIEGSTLADPILSQHRLAGSVPTIMREIDEIVRANLSTEVRFAGEVVDLRRPNVPFEAVQQFIRNALIHRNYEGTNAPVRVTWFDDRIEIHSPGGPFGQVTVETFGQPGVTDYRNPTLAGTLGQLGYVQRFGAGILVARAALEKNGNPPPELVPTPTHVLIVLRFTS